MPVRGMNIQQWITWTGTTPKFWPCNNQCASNLRQNSALSSRFKHATCYDLLIWIWITSRRQDLKHSEWQKSQFSAFKVLEEVCHPHRSFTRWRSWLNNVLSGSCTLMAWIDGSEPLPWRSNLKPIRPAQHNATLALYQFCFANYNCSAPGMTSPCEPALG